MRNVTRVLALLAGAVALSLPATQALATIPDQNPPVGWVYECPQQTQPGVAHCGAIRVIVPPPTGP